MSLPELCIRRPVMTTLLMLSFVIFGLFAYKKLPVAALPRVDYPTINVSVQMPGASPETMAASVAAPLERAFATISGLDLAHLGFNARQHPDNPAVQSRPRDRRRFPRRSVTNISDAATPAAGAAGAAELPEGESGRHADSLPRVEIRHSAAERGERMGGEHPSTADHAASRRRPGQYLRPAEIRGARLRRPARRGCARACAQ